MIKHFIETIVNYNKLKAVTFIILSFLYLSAYSQSEIETANKAYENSDFEGALTQYSTILNTKSADSLKYECYFGKALCLYRLEKYTEAKSNLKLAQTIKKVHRDYKFIMGNSFWLYGRIYSKEDKKKKSLRYFKKGAAYVQTSGLFSNIGFKDIQLNKYKEALRYLDQAIEMDNKNAYAYSNRALVFLKLLEFEKALKDIQKAIFLDQTNPYAFKHRAMIYLGLKYGQTTWLFDFWQ